MNFYTYFNEMVSSGTLRYIFTVIDGLFNNPMIYPLVSILISSFCIFIVCRLIWG